MGKLYGLIGFPLGHSFSRAYHNDRFERDGIDAEYCNYELNDITRLPHLVATHPTLMGLNVTIPHKESVIPFLDALDSTAQRIGAVNVIKIERKGDAVRMVGHNSDYMGFRNTISTLVKPHHTHALVLGSGGAAKAVSTALRDMGLTVLIVSRTPSSDMISYNDITHDVLQQYHVVVNATPLGMYPHVDTCPPIPYEALTPQHVCYDVVYNPQETLFMRRAKEHGAVVSCGLSMLHAQADAAWKIWNEQSK